MDAKSLRDKHVRALVQKWQEAGKSPRTIANQMSYLRWWSKKIEKDHLLRKTNAEYGVTGTSTQIPKRSKAWELTAKHLDQSEDPLLRFSLRLQHHFGLRREEAIKFRVSYADCGDHIRLKGSWTKGGRARTIPITTAEQRELLDEIHKTVGVGSLIPDDLLYVQQMRNYDKLRHIKEGHGLRHGYAQRRYKILTGWESPFQGGPKLSELNAEQAQIDHDARMQVSSELGHGRVEITSVYLGK